eukprot:11303743-Alexandrium_andersonii.AAC.1
MDAWHPAELAHMSPLAADWLTRMLKLVEATGQWPRQLARARAVYLSKSTTPSYDALSYRVLLIMAAVYRRWAAMRLQDLAPWVRQWALP